MEEGRVEDSFIVTQGYKRLVTVAISTSFRTEVSTVVRVD